MLERIADIQRQNPKLLFGLFIVLLLLFGGIASNLKIDPTFAALVGKDSEYNTNDRIIRNAFGESDALILLVKEDQQTILTNAHRLTDPEVGEYIAVLQATMGQSQYVKGIDGPFYSDDNRQTQIFLRLDVPETPTGFKEALTELQGLQAGVGAPPGIKATITGLPVLLDRVSTLLITDNLITVLITLLFVFGIIYWYARDFVYAIITVIPPITSLILLAAFMVLFNINVTITLAAVGVLVLGLGADYSIHIATHYRRARRDHDSHDHALKETIKDLQLPITASFITTLAGFSALILGVSPSSQSQGIVLALAIVLIYATTFLVFPLLVTLFARRIKVTENPTFTLIKRGLARLAIFQANHAKSVIVVVLLLTVVMFIGVTKVEFSTSNSNWIPDDDPIAKSFREITYAYGDSEQITLVLMATKSDLRSVQTARDANILTQLLTTIPNVDQIESPYEGISYDSGELHETLTGERAAAFNHDYTLTTIRISSQNINQDEAGDSQMLEEIRHLVTTHPIHNAKVALYGDPVRFEEIGDSLERDAGFTTVLGLALVFFMASVIYASVTIGLLALIPIIIAVLWALGLMGYFNVPFTSLSTGIISLVLGVGVDFSIHLVDGINKFAKRMRFDKAIAMTLEGTGSAIVLSAMTTFAGFMALTFANLLGTQRLGWSLAFSILSVFVVSMILVPAVMSWRFGRRRTK